MKFTSIKVKGVLIAPELQACAINLFLAEIRAYGAQRPGRLQQHLEDIGVPTGEPSYRGADRLLQKLRKAGVIRAVHGKGWEMDKLPAGSWRGVR